jgi:hypothetical protein
MLRASLFCLRGEGGQERRERRERMETEGDGGRRRETERVRGG